MNNDLPVIELETKFDHADSWHMLKSEHVLENSMHKIFFSSEMQIT